MSIAAAQMQYRQEFITGFERHQSLLRDSVTTEIVVKGNQAVFLVADSGGATAVTRGANGLIPSRADNNVQSTATLTEWHDLPRKTDFDIFASQANQRQIMQMTSMAVLGRRIDDDIVTELNTGTVNTGAATTASLSLVLKAKTKLQNAHVSWGDEICAAITPAFEGYLQQIAAYTSSDHVNVKPLVDGGGWEDKPKVTRWLGIKWVVHSGLPGVGTNAAKCFMYHRSAIGHAVDMARIEAKMGVNDEQAYQWVRCSAYSGAKLLQNSGVVVMNHDDSALS